MKKLLVRIFNRRYLTILLPIFFLLSAWLFFVLNTPVNLIIVLLTIIVFFVTIYSIVGKHIIRYWPLCLLFILGIGSFFLFSLFLFSWLAKLTLLLVFFLLIMVGLGNLEHLLWRPRFYQIGSLEQSINLLIFITLFCLTSSFYALNIFLNFPWLFFIIGLAGYLLLANFTVNQVNQISKNKKKSLYYIIIIDLIILEFFIVGRYLPIVYYTIGLLLSFSWYLLTTISQDYLIEQFNFKLVKRRTIVILVIMLLILLTARWK
ncbi:MAG: hypothetical protein KAS12_05000 [Candidatus Aenigmarchaeota archaeon]|nr:hypothetical protein [Candidatus Aenigmarchaeota archaeon]